MNKINYKYTIPITGYIYKVWSFLKKKKKSNELIEVRLMSDLSRV